MMASSALMSGGKHSSDPLSSFSPLFFFHLLHNLKYTTPCDIGSHESLLSLKSRTTLLLALESHRSDLGQRNKGLEHDGVV